MKKIYRRFTFTEISYHWVYAFTFMPLLVTGMIMILQRVFTCEWVTKETLTAAHKYIGISFIVCPFLVALAGDWRIHLTNLIEALTWTKRDFLWLYKMTIQSKDIPAAGKFNPGQKINMLLSLVNYFAFAITGAIMWLQKGALSAWYIHIILFVAAVPMLLGHLFLALINRSTRPGFPGMVTGNVPMSYMEHHHELVLKESRPLIQLRGWWKIIIAVPLIVIVFNVVNFLFHYQPVEKELGNLQAFNEKMMMPGELIRVHADKEENKNCYSCHDLGGKVSDSKCLACHEKIGKRIAENIGHHAKFKDNCSSCHQDHHGKDFEPRPLKMEEFNHEQALFSLVGAHKQVRCKECHQQDGKQTLTFTGISFTNCKDCHRTPHGKQFMDQKCTKCHEQHKWEKLLFDHNQDSRYKLVGKHQQQKCQECHKKQHDIMQYKEIAFDRCDRCHTNPHRVKLQTKCMDCHNESGWEKLQFSHSDTKFPLKGAHANISCAKCHKPTFEQGKKFVPYKIKTSCNSCHEDPHRKQLGDNCTKCHNQSGWKQPLLKFSHSKTKFLLKGAHADVSCAECHNPTFKQGKKFVPYKVKTSCNSCHKDQHRGQLGNNCAKCHNEKGWQLAFIKFNHDNADFKLKGAHHNVNCSECHKKDIHKVVTYKKIKHNKCSDCHEDIHRGIKSDCTKCHSEKGWTGKNLSFSHKNTRFPLRNDHKNVNCSECHQQKNIFAVKDVSCKSCHQDYVDIIAGKWKQKSVVADHHHNIVSCKKCHNDLQQSSIAQPEKMCSSCHTAHYERMYFEQKLFMNDAIRSMGKNNATTIEDIKKIGSHNFVMLKKLLYRRVEENK